MVNNLLIINFFCHIILDGKNYYFSRNRFNVYCVNSISEHKSYTLYSELPCTINNFKHKSKTCKHKFKNYINTLKKLFLI